MLYTPRPPQIIITDRVLEQRRTNIWAAMGFGKTGAVLTALDHLELVEDGPTLAIGPLRVAEGTWPDEVEKWDHLSSWRVSPVLGDPEARRRALRIDANLYTVNFENVPWLVDQFAKRPWPFKKVVWDEATRLAGFRLRQGTRRAKAIAPLAHTQINRWINLTGTPAPNGLLGLWGQNWFVDAGERLGRTFDSYRNRWFHTFNEKKQLSGGKHFNVPVIRPTDWAQDEISARLADVTISLAAKDWYPDLKEPIVNVIKVRLPPRARALYRDMERHMFMELAGFGVEAVHAAAKSIKCLQIASGAAYVDDTGQWREIHDAKLQALESVIAEAAGAPVLAVYQWKPTLARLLKAFPKAVHLNSNERIKAWNRGEIELGAVHPQSIGHGTSLQDGGNIICHVDQWWDMELFDQINERLGPMRQMQSSYDRDVFQHYIVAEDTTDETVMLRHVTKRSIQDLLMDAMKARGLDL